MTLIQIVKLKSFRILKENSPNPKILTLMKIIYIYIYKA